MLPLLHSRRKMASRNDHHRSRVSLERFLAALEMTAVLETVEKRRIDRIGSAQYDRGTKMLE
jgi:hypothetical protein